MKRNNFIWNFLAKCNAFLEAIIQIVFDSVVSILSTVLDVFR